MKIKNEIVKRKSVKREDKNVKTEIVNVEKRHDHSQHESEKMENENVKTIVENHGNDPYPNTRVAAIIIRRTRKTDEGSEAQSPG